jgi:hypothetical protein
MGMRQKLLETAPELVSAELAQTVREFCVPIDLIQEAYVGLTEITRDFTAPEEHLAVAFVLHETDAETEEGAREVRLVTDRFYESMPEDVQAGGCGFLEPGGIDVWQEKAQRVYAR